MAFGPAALNDWFNRIPYVNPDYKMRSALEQCAADPNKTTEIATNFLGDFNRNPFKRWINNNYASTSNDNPIFKFFKRHTATAFINTILASPTFGLNFFVGNRLSPFFRRDPDRPHDQDLRFIEKATEIAAAKSGGTAAYKPQSSDSASRGVILYNLVYAYQRQRAAGMQGKMTPAISRDIQNGSADLIQSWLETAMQNKKTSGAPGYLGNLPCLNNAMTNAQITQFLTLVNGLPTSQEHEKDFVIGTLNETKDFLADPKISKHLDPNDLLTLNNDITGRLNSLQAQNALGAGQGQSGQGQRRRKRIDIDKKVGPSLLASLGIGTAVVAIVGFSAYTAITKMFHISAFDLTGVTNTTGSHQVPMKDQKGNPIKDKDGKILKGTDLSGTSADTISGAEKTQHNSTADFLNKNQSNIPETTDPKTGGDPDLSSLALGEFNQQINVGRMLSGNPAARTLDEVGLTTTPNAGSIDQAVVKLNNGVVIEVSTGTAPNVRGSKASKVTQGNVEVAKSSDPNSKDTTTLPTTAFMMQTGQGSAWVVVSRGYANKNDGNPSSYDADTRRGTVNVAVCNFNGSPTRPGTFKDAGQVKLTATSEGSVNLTGATANKGVCDYYARQLNFNLTR